MTSEDIVRPDLSLVSFRHTQTIDEKALFLSGKIDNGTFNGVRKSGGREAENPDDHL